MEPKIVAGLTDSDHASAILDVAKAFGEHLGLPVEVVSSPTDDVFVVGERRDEILAAGRTAIGGAVDVGAADRVTIAPGPPAEVLRSAMADGGVLGVVGTRGQKPFRGALLGSVSTALTKTAPCPLVIVPEGAPPPDLARRPAMVCRLDGSAEDMRTLREAVHLAVALGTRMLAVNVADGAANSFLLPAPVRIERELEALPRIDTAIRVETDDPVGTMREVADKHDASMLIIGGRDTSRLRDSLGGNLTVKLIAEARRPVVVMPPRAQAETEWRAPLAQLSA